MFHFLGLGKACTVYMTLKGADSVLVHSVSQDSTLGAANTHYLAGLIGRRLTILLKDGKNCLKWL